MGKSVFEDEQKGTIAFFDVCILQTRPTKWQQIHVQQRSLIKTLIELYCWASAEFITTFACSDCQDNNRNKRSLTAHYNVHPKTFQLGNNAPVWKTPDNLSLAVLELSIASFVEIVLSTRVSELLNYLAAWQILFAEEDHGDKTKALNEACFGLHLFNPSPLCPIHSQEFETIVNRRERSASTHSNTD